MDELRERLAMHLCKAQHDGPDYCGEDVMTYWNHEADAVLAEIGRTHAIVPLDVMARIEQRLNDDWEKRIAPSLGIPPRHTR